MAAATGSAAAAAAGVASSHLDLRLRLAGGVCVSGGGGNPAAAGGGGSPLLVLPLPFCMLLLAKLSRPAASVPVALVTWGCTAATEAAAAALLETGVMLGRGGKTWGLSAGREPETKRSKS